MDLYTHCKVCSFICPSYPCYFHLYTHSIPTIFCSLERFWWLKPSHLGRSFWGGWSRWKSPRPSAFWMKLIFWWNLIKINVVWHDLVALEHVFFGVAQPPTSFFLFCSKKPEFKWENYRSLVVSSDDLRQPSNHLVVFHGWTGHGFPSQEVVKGWNPLWSHEHSRKLAARYPMKSPNFCWSNESHPHENSMKSSCLLVKFYWISLNVSQIHENERFKDRELWGFSVAGEIVGEPYWVCGVVLAPGWESAAIVGIHVGLVVPHPPKVKKQIKFDKTPYQSSDHGLFLLGVTIAPIQLVHYIHI